MSRLVPETLRIVSGGPFQKPVLPCRPLFRPPDHPDAVVLRDRYGLLGIAGQGGDFERARRLKTWVRSRWNHGWDNEGQREALEILARAEQGGSFNCGFYARTLTQCCLSIGLPARQMEISREGYDFPDTCLHNAGHSVVEVYCRDLGKWVMLDSDANAFYAIDDVPASCLDVHRAWHADRGQRVKQVEDEPPLTVPTSCPVVSPAYLRQMFRELARHKAMDYYYHIAARASHGYVAYPEGADRRTVRYTGVTPPLLAAVYRGVRLDGAILVDDEAHFNWPIDRTFVQATMAAERPSRRIEIRLDHNMPFFDHFELRVGRGPFRRLKGDRRIVTLDAGKTTIRARCVDVFGLAGHEAALVVHLKPASAKTLDRRRTEYWR